MPAAGSFEEAPETAESCDAVQRALIYSQDLQTERYWCPATSGRLTRWQQKMQEHRARVWSTGAARGERASKRERERESETRRDTVVLYEPHELADIAIRVVGCDAVNRILWGVASSRVASTALWRLCAGNRFLVSLELRGRAAHLDHTGVCMHTRRNRSQFRCARRAARLIQSEAFGPCERVRKVLTVGEGGEPHVVLEVGEKGDAVLLVAPP